MIQAASRIAAVTALLCLAPLARAAEPERVVVRNRIHEVGGRFELTVGPGFTMVNRLTSHVDLRMNFAINLGEEWALEASGGFSDKISKHTSVADDVEDSVVTKDPNANNLRITDDFQDLWIKRFDGGLRVRWQPIYGKMSLITEVPVHFQAYLFAGGGAGMFSRDSIVYCLERGTGTSKSTGRQGAVCNQPLHEEQLKPVASFGAGMRFFLFRHGALRLELRDSVLPDEYRVNINRADAATGNANVGEQATNPGLEHLFFFDVGYTILF